MAYQTYFKQVPDNSKLVLLGDFFKKRNGDWRVVAYFQLESGGRIKKAFPIDALPFLTPGSHFPPENIIKNINGYKGTFVLPSMEQWQKTTLSEMPNELKRMQEYKEQVSTQVVYKLKVDGYSYWLPVIELARRLHFNSSELVRTAFLEGTTKTLARVGLVDWQGRIDFMPNVPVAYINSPEYRKYFAWLMFDEGVEDSFCSIFKYKNRNTQQYNDHDRWTFDFIPPSLSAVELSWSGFTTRDQKHRYIREITSLAGVKAPKVDSVIFSHPEDYKADSIENNTKEKTSTTSKGKPNNIEIDTELTPTSGNKHRIIHISKSGLHFDLEIDTRRCPRHYKLMPEGTESVLDEIQEDEIVGITEGDKTGKKPRADFDIMKEPEHLDGIDKFDVFKQLLLKLSEKKTKWKISIHIERIPKGRSRTLYKIDGRHRNYLHAIIQKNQDTQVHILEVELAKGDSLSTLICRIKSDLNISEVIETTLTDLINNSLSWKRKNIHEVTISRAFLGHPDHKIIHEKETLESWVKRAIINIKSV
ncbi:MAG: Tn7-like element transposition protein TnsE [Gammaproteobacteria bacterium]|nr:Tn7-like element transposition protein TnsE [Gammaproteobacteria bacterium]